jgi:hypothetical protein
MASATADSMGSISCLIGSFNRFVPICLYLVDGRAV